MKSVLVLIAVLAVSNAFPTSDIIAKLSELSKLGDNAEAFGKGLAKILAERTAVTGEEEPMPYTDAPISIIPFAAVTGEEEPMPYTDAPISIIPFAAVTGEEEPMPYVVKEDMSKPEHMDNKQAAVTGEEEPMPYTDAPISIIPFAAVTGEEEPMPYVVKEDMSKPEHMSKQHYTIW